MLTVEQMIARVRGRTHDEQETGYTDDTLLGYINDGIRFLRRTIISIAPNIMEDTICGSIDAGVQQIKLVKTVTDSVNETENVVPVNVSCIVDVRVDGKRLKKVSRQGIADLNAVGNPTGYYMSGFDTVCVYPTPDTEKSYTVTAISDFEELTGKSDKSPFTNDLDDFLYEYVSIRASLTNEFDMTQEASIMGQIVSQVEMLLRQMTTNGIDVTGYWDTPVQGYKPY